MEEIFGQCSCGSAWFKLQPHEDEPSDEVEEALAAVAIDTQGMITGYAGKLVCIECSSDWDPSISFKQTRSHLRVVQ